MQHLLLHALYKKKLKEKTNKQKITRKKCDAQYVVKKNTDKINKKQSREDVLKQVNKIQFLVPNTQFLVLKKL